MKSRRLLSTILALCLCGAAASAAPARRASSRSGAAAKTKTVKKASAKTTKSRASRSTRKRTTARARTSASPRQTQPTPERYIEIQQALAERGFYGGPVDGKWTAECVVALKQFQADQNLSPDGKLGALSLIALGLGPKRDGDRTFLGKPEPAQ